MTDEKTEKVDEKPAQKEDNRPGFTQEDKVAYKRLEMQYGGQVVEDTVQVVREEMNLSVDDVEVEVARRLREKHDHEVREKAEDVLEKARQEREVLFREKELRVEEEIKRKKNDRVREEEKSHEKKN